MKLKLLLTIIAISFLLACSGGSTDPKTLFPEKIGDAKLNRIELSPDNDWFDQYYKVSKAESPYKSVSAVYEMEGVKTIEYRVTDHRQESAAGEELSEIAKCENFDSSAKDWREIPLKDKSGKEIGKAKVCRTDPGFDGQASYYFGIQKGSRTYTIDGSNQIVGKSVVQNTEKIAGFIKNLPTLSSDLEFSFLDEVTADIAKNKGVSIDELEKLSPPEQLAAEPYLKGKVYQIKSADGDFVNNDLRAKITAEIGTVLKVECKRSFSIGNYTAEGQSVPAYANACDVTVIDYTIPAVIAKKSFVNSQLPTSMTFGTTDGKITKNEVVARAPTGEIQKWLDGLPRK